MSDSQSPWNDPDPVFKEVPKVNPKTDKPPIFYMCSLCGALVANRKLHIKWHRKNSPIF